MSQLIVNGNGTPVSPRKAAGFLVLATVIWGSSFIPMKWLVSQMPLYELLAIRFFFASLVLLPWLFPRIKKLNQEGNLRPLFKSSLILGLLSWGGLVTQTAGMLYTTATNAAFITGLNVVMVPILMAFMGHHKPDMKSWGCIFLALAGLVLFSLTASLRVNPGDILVLLCAILFSFHIIYTTRFTRIYDPVTIAGFQFIIQFVFFLLASLFMDAGKWVQPNAPQLTLIILLGIFGTTVAMGIQAVYQRWTQTHKAALIYLLEPVFAALLGYLILGELLSLRQWAGALIMLGAMALSELPLKNGDYKSNKA
jgi:drug/metabolite transporter (DMT)-like permease